jgi:hypothetical protein
MMRSERDHHKAHADMREIEVKRMKRVENSPVTKGKEVAIPILNQSGGKENNPLTNRAEETSPTATRMTSRQCESPRLSLLAVMLKLWSRCSSARVTPVLRVRGAKRLTAVQGGVEFTTSGRASTILELETQGQVPVAALVAAQQYSPVQ